MLIVADSQIWYSEKTKTNGIASVISSEMSDTSNDGMVMVHVETNDEGDRSEGLFKEFQNLLR